MLLDMDARILHADLDEMNCKKANEPEKAQGSGILNQFKRKYNYFIQFASKPLKLCIS